MPRSKSTSEEGLTPEQAQKMLQADMANILKKLKEGKTLTVTERNRLQGVAESGTLDTGEQPIVPSYVKLAEVLEVSRDTINEWRKMHDDWPRPRSNGKHNVQEWRDFIKRHGLGRQGVNLGEPADDDEDLDDLDTLKRRDLQVKIEERELKIAVTRGEFIAVDDVREFFARKSGDVISLLRNKFENEYPPLIAGLEPPEIREKSSQVIDEICRILSTGDVTD